MSLSLVIPERLHSKIQVCFHRVKRMIGDLFRRGGGIWTSIMSPYEERYVDVKFIGEIPGSLSVAVEEDFQRWRLFYLSLDLFYCCWRQLSSVGFLFTIAVQ